VFDFAVQLLMGGQNQCDATHSFLFLIHGVNFKIMNLGLLEQSILKWANAWASIFK
jgi:hypothetical protein